jgi:hypothetical protein
MLALLHVRMNQELALMANVVMSHFSAKSATPLMAVLAIVWMGPALLAQSLIKDPVDEFRLWLGAGSSGDRPVKIREALMAMKSLVQACNHVNRWFNVRQLESLPKPDQSTLAHRTTRDRRGLFPEIPCSVPVFQNSKKNYSPWQAKDRQANWTRFMPWAVSIAHLLNWGVYVAEFWKGKTILMI